MLEAVCYDDGMNIGRKIEILGGTIYCFSKDNDGIDSNGSIYIKGGTVISVNQNKPNESLDSESRQLYFSGGTVLGIGSGMVKVGSSSIPYYNTLFNNNPEFPIRRGLRLHFGKYIYLMHQNTLVMALRNDNKESRCFVTAIHPDMVENEEYMLYEGDMPLDYYDSLFDGRFIIGGKTNEAEIVDIIYPNLDYNNNY